MQKDNCPVRVQAQPRVERPGWRDRQLAFTASFDSTAKLGETLEGLNNDPVMAAWRMKNIKANLASWVRSNQAYEIPI